MFFVFIPYSCVFIHESMRYFLPVDPFEKAGKPIAIVVIAFCVFMALTFHDRLYTTVTFTLLGMFLTLNLVTLKSWFLGRFFLTYLISLIPFAVVNGLLTSMPVLIYNDLENSGIRIGTIPFEDFFYSMLMLLMNITIYEHLMKKK
jgi:lycopene cyclase domain-containing protein